MPGCDPSFSGNLSLDLTSPPGRPTLAPSMRTHRLQPTRLLRPWDFPGKSAGVGCHCILRKTLWSELLCPPPGHLPHPGIGPWLPHWQEDSLPLEPPGKPIICRRHWLSWECVLASRDRAQGCCSASYSAQDRRPDREASGPKRQWYPG